MEERFAEPGFEGVRFGRVQRVAGVERRAREELAAPGDERRHGLHGRRVATAPDAREQALLQEVQIAMLAECVRQMRRPAREGIDPPPATTAERTQTLGEIETLLAPFVQDARIRLVAGRGERRPRR